MVSTRGQKRRGEPSSPTQSSGSANPPKKPRQESPKASKEKKPPPTRKSKKSKKATAASESGSEFEQSQSEDVGTKNASATSKPASTEAATEGKKKRVSRHARKASVHETEDDVLLELQESFDDFLKPFLEMNDPVFRNTTRVAKALQSITLIRQTAATPPESANATYFFSLFN